MKRWVFALGVIAAASAFAQVSPVRTQVIDYSKDPDVIDGSILRPDLTGIDTRAPATFSRIIQVRSDFKDKIRSTQLP
jgi:hypothetical protein